MLFAILLATTAASATDDFKLDTKHSAVLFKAHHLGAGYTWGRFNDFEGSWTAEGEKLMSLTVSVKAESIDTSVDKRDKHLRGPDYLEAATFPTIDFKSTRIRCADGTCNVKGDLTLHGVTKRVTAELTHTGEGEDPWGGYRQGWEGVLQVNMPDYGIDQEGVGDQLGLTIAIEGKKR
jgi:polyisoprenoid-binding protein YceI